jgi:hypothetical protein
MRFKLWDPTSFRVIFLVPAFAALFDATCATKPQTAAATQKAVIETLEGNTVRLVEADAYAFIRPDGTLVGRNHPSGATSGTWYAREDGVLCATWLDSPDPGERCATLHPVDRDTFEWAGNRFDVFEGNPENL